MPLATHILGTSRWIVLGFIAVAVLVAAGVDSVHSAAEKTPKFSAEQLRFYEKEVLPILKENCFKCHAGSRSRGGLRLDSRAAILKGGDLGPAVLLEKMEASPLLKAIHFKDGLEMPPSGKLPADKIATLARWVQQGLPFPPGKEPIVSTPEAGKPTITDADRSWWAYRPLTRPIVPGVARTGWTRNPIDHFILHRLEAKKLTPSSEADRVALLRRACYDLTGLPPTPDQVDAFLADRRPDAYERLIDDLLASPGYGEKWGRHWLDLVRFAETHGYERDSVKPFAWRYRDYVIDAFNRDKPYDRFLVEQLAGDELEEPTTESLIATGFYRLGIWDDEPADRLQARYDVLDGIASTTGQVVLGMSIGCARCHDHKKDPLPQRDYYSFLAFFHDVSDMNARNTRRIVTEADRLEREAFLRRKQQTEGKLYQQIYELEQKFLKSLVGKKGIDTASLVGSDMVDLSYRFYRDTWERLPNFDAIKAEESGVIASNLFSLTPASRPDAMGLVFEGKLKVPSSGEYRFFTEASDGIRLTLNNKPVIDRPEKGKHRAEGKVRLDAGLAPIRLEYFNTYNQPALRIAWEGPGVERRSLSDEGNEQILIADSRTSGQTWAYHLQTPGTDWTSPDFNDSAWKKGMAGFGRRGTPGAIVRTPWESSGSIYLRKSFDITRLPRRLVLNLHHDDDVQVFLNGRRIYQAKGYLTSYQRIPLGAEATEALRMGRNVLAVQCRQHFGGQYIDLGLIGDGKVDLRSLVAKYGTELLGETSHRRYAELQAELDRQRKLPIPEVGMEVMAVIERGSNPTRVLIRGNPHAPGEVVTADIPEVLRQGNSRLTIARRKESSGKRYALAQWLTSPSNALTARVMVNRLWQYHFGRAISPSSSDLGKLGDLPSHPELLDWLACELQRDWSLKRMHRLIMTSATYRQSSKGRPEELASDPANVYYWRFPMRRLSAEEVRDSILAASGELNRRMAGPGVYPKIPKEVLAGQSRPGDGWGTSPREEQARRSIYVHMKRSLIVPILETHDLADTDSSCAVRYTTTVPTQALGMLNGDFTNEQATRLAERLLRDQPDNPALRIERAIRLTTGRLPDRDEITRELAFVNDLQKSGNLDPASALRMYALLLLNSNEFIYLD